MVKEQIEMVVPIINLHPLLTFDETEADPQFQDEGFNLAQDRLRALAVAADPNVSRQGRCVARAELQRHKAALGKAEQESLIRRIAFSLRLLQNFGKNFA